MAEDIPKTTIAVLLVLTVVISIACTWVVLDKTMGAKVVYPAAPGQSNGQVKVSINSGEEVSAPAVTGNSVANVQVKIN